MAAFVIEAVQGKSCRVVADGYLAEAQKLCRKAGRPAGDGRSAVRPRPYRQVVRLPALAGSGAGHRMRGQGAFGRLRSRWAP